MTLIDDYTKLLLHMDGDQSASKHEITFNGNPKFDNSVKKIGKSSIYLPNNTSYLSIPNNPDWDLGSEDFTLECWVNFGQIQGDSYQIFGKYLLGSISSFMGLGLSLGNTFRFRAHTTGRSFNVELNGTTGIQINTWYHIAAVRFGITFYLFVNGNIESSLTASGAITTNTQPLTISHNNSGYAIRNAYISEARLSKGIARWTENFTPTTQKYTADSYTKLLLHFEGDQGVTGHAVTSNGNPKLNAVTTKFDGAMYFDGNDYLSIPDSNDWDFGNGDFTIDFWIKADYTKSGPIVGRGWVNRSWTIYLYTDGYVGFFADSNGSYSWEVSIGNTTGQIPNNMWSHVAFVKNGSSWYKFIDGDLKQTVNSSITIYNSSNPLNIGGDVDGSTWYYSNIYIDELQISKGIARWTENFTPPAAAYRWPMIGGTLAEDAIIMVIKESDYTKESANYISAGEYEIECYGTSSRLIFARKSDGEIEAYGNVIPQ